MRLACKIRDEYTAVKDLPPPKEVTALEKQPQPVAGGYAQRNGKLCHSCCYLVIREDYSRLK